MQVTLEVSGTEGMITYDRSGLSQPIKVFSRNQTQRYFSEKVESDRGWLFPTVDEYWRYGYYDQIRHFVECIQSGARPESDLRGRCRGQPHHGRRLCVRGRRRRLARDCGIEAHVRAGGIHQRRTRRAPSPQRGEGGGEGAPALRSKCRIPLTPALSPTGRGGQAVGVDGPCPQSNSTYERRDALPHDPQGLPVRDAADHRAGRRRRSSCRPSTMPGSPSGVTTPCGTPGGSPASTISPSWSMRRRSGTRSGSRACGSSATYRVQLVVGMAAGACPQLGQGVPRDSTRPSSWCQWVSSFVIVAVVFLWLYHPDLGVLNDLLMRLGLVETPVAWLASPGLAMVSLIVANTWKFFPLVAITLFTGLQAIPREGGRIGHRRRRQSGADTAPHRHPAARAVDRDPRCSCPPSGPSTPSRWRSS